jgi:hypothetical protein
MTGIDTVAAAILASRIDSLLNSPVTAPAAGAATPQVGTSATAAGAAAPAPLPPGAPPPPLASAQAVLSEVALTLDAISRFGGDASAPVLGNAPLLPAGPGAQPAASSPSGAQAGADPAATQAGATATTAAQATGALPGSPAAALSAALAQAVANSGLFYESHLAQWLAGQRAFSTLASEPQARFAADGAFAQPGGAPANADDPLADALAARLPLPQSSGRPSGETGAATTGSSASGAAQQNSAQGGAASARPGNAYATSSEPESRSLAGASTSPGATRAESSAEPPASLAASLHPATLPIVRQQLDLLATDQFRWVGEVWPGARLDWLIEPDEPDPRERGAGDPGDGIAWRTRLTLALPSLGMVDADLVLNGTQLTARLRANEAGAARLTSHGEALRERLAAAGLQLSGLSIRAIEDAPPESFDAAAAQAAASAYARSAVADEVLPAEPRPPAPTPARAPLDDWEWLS